MPADTTSPFACHEGRTVAAEHDAHDDYVDPLHGIALDAAPCRHPELRDYWEGTQEAVRWVYLQGWGTGSARALAQVLLGTYNSSEYRADLIDICALDEARFLLAMDVLRLRFHAIEPHETFRNGSQIFNAMGDKYRGAFPAVGSESRRV